jgi:hypothetical protein
MSYPMYLNATPIVAEKKVRKNVIAYKFRSGIIEINGWRFFFYSMTQAIKKWRKDNPIN